MRTNEIRIVFCILAGLFWAVVSVGAQAPPGPMTQTTAPAAATAPASAPAKAAPPPDVPRKKDLTGSWRLNKDESTQPRKRDDNDSGGRHGGGRPSGGWPGGGRGGYG